MGKILRNRYLFSALFLLLTAQAQATWVGVFVYRNIFNDHIHVSVSDDGDFNHAMQLNIWASTPFAAIRMSYELKHAHKFVIFHHDKAKNEIVDEWELFFKSILSQRSLLSKNCAYATNHLLTDILGIDLYKGFVFARSALIVKQPFSKRGIALPDGVRKKLVKTLKRKNIKFYTEKTVKNLETFTPEI